MEAFNSFAHRKGWQWERQQLNRGWWHCQCEAFHQTTKEGKCVSFLKLLVLLNYQKMSVFPLPKNDSSVKVQISTWNWNSYIFFLIAGCPGQFVCRSTNAGALKLTTRQTSSGLRFWTFGIHEIQPCDPLGASPLIATSCLLDQTPWGWNWNLFWGMIEIFLMKFHFL